MSKSLAVRLRHYEKHKKKQHTNAAQRLSNQTSLFRKKNQQSGRRNATTMDMRYVNIVMV